MGREISCTPKLRCTALVQKRRSGAERSGVANAESNVSFMEQLGGGDVREAPSRSRCCSMKSRAPLGEMRSAASVSPNEGVTGSPTLQSELL